MSKTIEITREDAFFLAGDDCLARKLAANKLQTLLNAAPAVERQEPAAYIVEAIDPNNGHLRRRGLHWHSVETLRETRDFKEWIGENITKEQPLYTSQQVVVTFNENTEFEKWWCRLPILRKNKRQVAQEAWQQRATLATQVEEK